MKKSAPPPSLLPTTSRSLTRKLLQGAGCRCSEQLPCVKLWECEPGKQSSAVLQVHMAKLKRKKSIVVKNKKKCSSWRLWYYFLSIVPLIRGRTCARGMASLSVVYIYMALYFDWHALIMHCKFKENVAMQIEISTHETDNNHIISNWSTDQNFYQPVYILLFINYSKLKHGNPLRVL